MYKLFLVSDYRLLIVDFGLAALSYYRTFLSWVIKIILILHFPKLFCIPLLLSGWRDQTVDTNPGVLPWTKRSGSSSRVFVMQSCTSKSQIPVMSWVLLHGMMAEKFYFLQVSSSCDLFFLLIINVVEVLKLTLNHSSRTVYNTECLVFQKVNQMKLDLYKCSHKNFLNSRILNWRKSRLLSI